jgi:hypothetical protein
VEAQFMSIFSSIGENVANSFIETPQQENQERIDFKKLYINLKDAESILVRFLGHADVVEYKSHSSWEKSLHNQTCTRKNGECAYCQAASYAKDNGMEDWNVYAKSRFLFAMYDLEKQEIRLFNASKNQAKVLFSTISEYKDDLDTTSMKFSRSGNKTETTYTLAPQLRIKDKKIQEAFDAASGLKVDEKTFEKALIVRTFNGQVKHLKELGFPVEKVFKNEIVTEPPIEVKDIKDDDLPF